MRQALLALVLTTLPLPLAAQTDDRGILTRFLEENLSGAGRVVTITGFAGALSSRATMDQITIADDDGIWITLRDITFDWDRSSLLQGELTVNALTAGEIILARPPRTTPDLPSPEARGFLLPDLPVSVEIGRVAAERIVLGEAVLGQPVEASLEASLSLVEGAGAATIRLERTDIGPQGQLALDASYSNLDRILTIDLAAIEGQGGVATDLLNIPDKPSLDLEINGTGPIDDFTASISLAANGQSRIAGDVRLLTDADNRRSFRADITGDLAPLLLPQYTEFFGPEVRLLAEGARAPDGSFDLPTFRLTARALDVAGSLAVAADGVPERFALNGRLGLPDGSPVLLPLGGETQTRVTSADLTLTYDAAQADGWTLQSTLNRLDSTGLSAETLRLSGTGRIYRVDGDAMSDGTLQFDALGLAPADPNLGRALGERVTGDMAFSWREADPLRVSRLRLAGTDYSLSASGIVGSLAKGVPLSGTAAVDARDISRFSGLAGRPLSGSLAGDLRGGGTLVGGAFDIDAGLRGNDVAVGMAEIDGLLRGLSQISLSARRDETGTLIRSLRINANTFLASAEGKIASDASTVTARFALSDLAALGPGFGGSATGSAVFTGTTEDGTLILKATTTDLRTGSAEAARLLAGQTTLSVDLAARNGVLRIDGASLQNPRLQATAQGTPEALDLEARLADVGILVDGFSGPVTLVGTAGAEAQTYRINLGITGPGGIDARVQGTVATNFSAADLALSGTAQAALANTLLGPRAISGPLRFNLSLDGPIARSSLSGDVTLSDARLSDPDLPFALTALNGTAALSGGTARLAFSGELSTGGSVSGSGSVSLASPFDSRLALTLGRVTLRDPRLYEARIEGAVTVTGPLAGGATIAGSLTLIEANLRIPSTGLGVFGSLPDLQHINEPADVRLTRARARLIASTGGAATPSLPYALDLVINAPNRIFVRGRGLEAEFGGALRLTGTSANVIPSGAFDLIRGRLDILGKRLDIASARLALQGSFDPYIDATASLAEDEVTVFVSLSGQASNPEVTFTSIPDLPEEEVLARLLFGQDISQISPFQALQLANAVATLAGRGGDGILGRLRQNFGLDEFDVQINDDGGVVARAGKYLSRNLYTEVQVGQDGTTEIHLNLDVTDKLTIRGSVSGDGQTGLGVFIEDDY